MKYLLLSNGVYQEIELPEIVSPVRGNATTSRELSVEASDVIVDTIYNIGILLTKALEEGGEIVELAKDGIKGVKEWAQIITLIPKLIPIFVLLQEVIENAPEFYEQFKNVTPEQLSECKQAFAQSFDIPNDKIEHTVEQSLAIVLSILSLVQSLK
ncbi:MAG TPA: hypothetical protein PKD00_00390 [Burkholderiales bacterium]|nr:hypothetical protein [Burkholderiales bacterium]